MGGKTVRTYVQGTVSEHGTRPSISDGKLFIRATGLMYFFSPFGNDWHSLIIQQVSVYVCTVCMCA